MQDKPRNRTPLVAPILEIIAVIAGGMATYTITMVFMAVSAMDSVKADFYGKWFVLSMLACGVALIAVLFSRLGGLND